MAHYYAFCTVHKKCGPNRTTASKAAEDCNKHAATVAGPHGEIYPKMSNFKKVNGVKKFFYKSFKKSSK